MYTRLSSHFRFVANPDINPFWGNFRIADQTPEINSNLYSLVVTNTYSLDTRDRPGLLFAMMRTFASDQSRIAFEGDLATTELYRLEGASYDETDILKERRSRRVSTLLFCPLS